MNSLITLSPVDADARKRRELRESKLVREWSSEERCEAFREARRVEVERAGAGVVEHWELCEDCHEYKCERGFSSCKKCLEQMRRYAN